MSRPNRPAVVLAGVVVLALAIGLPLAFARGGHRTHSSADRSPSASDAPSPSPTATDPSPTAPPAASTASAGTPSPVAVSPSRPATITAPAPAPAGSPCAGQNGDGGNLTVCPASGPVGTAVTLSSDQLCGASTPDGVVAVFLGPQAYVGSGGGGNQVPGPYQAKGHGFTVSYRIPASYQTSGGQAAAVGPGAVTFATYPAGLCSVPFTVTAH